MNRLSIFWLVLIALLPVGTTANSGVLYSTFGAGYTYSPSVWVIDWYGIEIGAPFALASDATLDSIDFAARYDAGPNQLRVILESDASGVPSGSGIESFNFTNLSSASMVYSANSLLHPLLTAGTPYWVVLTTDDPVNSSLGWNLNSLGIKGMASNIGSTWYFFSSSFDQTPAFDITGTPVPEPATMLLLGSGLVGLAGYGRKKFFKK